ncbi:hypothetical protein [Amycolatopsis nivea]|uniref:hypothetical protein n=1 Tax=Amycolatopsis nivea TaxID=1644109 RepID=UPI0010703B23|nr:hypothetical protein [Amycolatopsis nivea]
MRVQEVADTGRSAWWLRPPRYASGDEQAGLAMPVQDPRRRLRHASGLGIEVDEAAVRRADETGHAWRSPVWRLPDGSFTEW